MKNSAKTIKEAIRRRRTVERMVLKAEKNGRVREMLHRMVGYPCSLTCTVIGWLSVFTVPEADLMG